MTIDQLQQLIANGESKNLEFKKTTGELKDAMHTACAFLNSDGGWLLFGIAPTSYQVLGQQVTDNTQREIAQALSHIEPAITVDVDYIPIPNKDGYQVIAMHFDSWQWGNEPYTYHGCPYYKVESTTMEMPRTMFEQRIKAAKPHFFGWEKQIAQGVTISDLDENRIRGVVRLGVEQGRLLATANSDSIEDILRKFRLIHENHLTQAAVMLFAKNTDNYPQLLLRMARFIGTDKNEFLDNQRAEGNFFDLLDAGMQFAYKHLNIHGKVIGLHRQDKLEIPIMAMREALINALCHRSYDMPGASVGLAIYDDRVEIENPGQLPDTLTIESLLLPHASYPTNPDIAQVLFKTTYLENWGSGVKRILDACKEDNVPMPHYELRSGGIVIVFPRPDYKESVIENVTENVIENVIENVTERQHRIITMMQADPTISVATIAKALGVTSMTIRRDIEHISIIHHVGPDKGGYWKIDGI